MSTSPLIKVACSAFSNGSALTFKKKQLSNSQTQNFMAGNSPLKSIDENEQSPSKIINIYSDSALFNVGNSYSTVKNAPIIEEEKTHKTYTYSQMPPDEAEKAYCERQKIIKEQINRTKNSGKFKPKKRIDPNKSSTLKSVLKKQQLDYSTAQSQQIDVSRTSQTFRRKSIDQPIQTVPKPHPKVSKIIENNNSNNNIKQSQINSSNVLQQTFHQQLQSKKQQLLNEIAQLDKEIVKEKEKKQQSLVQSINISPRVQQIKQTPCLKDDLKSTYEKRQQMKKVADKEKQRKEMEQCTFKPQISSNTNRKLNTSQSSKFTPLTSPKQNQVANSIKVPTRSQSQEERIVKTDALQKDQKYDLNQRLQRMNEKYNMILEQSNKIRTQLKQN
ncbi:unnamed protein product [Paramecium pentaurelia]|uniref:Uncharacterized protein n=1 Tax=Paramecium pentaurelia TaxID=43138 RepID=A0A8S1WLS1_9CILI|nr:unnamed protein product [Paramecium pentaurelia]